MDIRQRKTIFWFLVFDLVMGLVVLPLTIGPESTIAFFRIVFLDLLGPILIVGLVAGVLWAAACTIRLRLAQKALYRADYPRALRLMGKMRHEYSALILELAGRSKEAEEALRRQLQNTARPAQRARLLGILGEAVMDQGRWEESKAMLEEAIALDAGRGSAWDTLASWHLQQGAEPQRALDLLEQANAAPGLAKLKPAVRDGFLSFRLTTKSVALARLGRQSEAEAALAEGFRLANTSYVPGMALMHWDAARAFASMQQFPQAREHARKAAALDPHGKYGRLAAGWLEANLRSAAGGSPPN